MKAAKDANDALLKDIKVIKIEHYGERGCSLRKCQTHYCHQCAALNSFLCFFKGPSAAIKSLRCDSKLANLYFYVFFVHFNGFTHKPSARESPSWRSELDETAFAASVIFAALVVRSSPAASHNLISRSGHSLSSPLPRPRPHPPAASFITGPPPLSGDDHLSSTGSRNRLVNALIAFSLHVG